MIFSIGCAFRDRRAMGLTLNCARVPVRFILAFCTQVNETFEYGGFVN